MKEVYKLVKWTLIDSKGWAIIGLMLLLIPWVCPYIAPTQEERELYMPALAQGAWQTLWWAGTLFLVTQAANLGYQHRKFGIYDYLTAKKITKTKILIGSMLPQMMIGIILGIIPLLICVIVAIPNMVEEQRMWIITQIQAYTLWIAVIPIFIAIPYALAYRLSSSVTATLTVIILLYGYQGINYIDMIRRNAAIDPVMANITEVIWVISPHIYMADITDRMIFKLGELPTASWIFTLLYFVAYGIIAITISRWIIPTQGPGKKEKAKKHVI